MGIPDVFCWTRFGVEAGQDFSSILERKEDERQKNGGLFLWGIGNSITPSLDKLLHINPAPKVVFSPIRSQPRRVDEKPSHVAVWTSARTPRGEVFGLPQGSLLTSHASGATKRRHHALVLQSSQPLALNDDGERFTMSSLRNLRTGNPVGFSQVTAIVRRSKNMTDNSGTTYSAAMVVDLVYPFVLTLENPVILPTEGIRNDALTKLCWDVKRSHQDLVADEQLALFD